MLLFIAQRDINHMIAIAIVVILGLLVLPAYSEREQKEDDMDDPTENMYL